MEIWREAKRIVEQKQLLLKAMKRVEGETLDYQLLQTIVDAAQDKEIIIKLRDETIIRVKPKDKPNEDKSFRQKFSEMHSV